MIDELALLSVPEDFSYVSDFRHQPPMPIVDKGPMPIVDKGNFGPMKLGDNGVAEVVQPFSLGPGGLTVTVASSTETISRTAYVVSNPYQVVSERRTKKELRPGMFSYSPQLIAEVWFDNPQCDDDSKRWAVGVNFKFGDQQDGGPPSDNPIGPTCQFFNHGEINLHGPDAVVNPVHLENYDQYAATSTRFRLRVSLNRTTNTADAKGWLTIYKPIANAPSFYDTTLIPIDEKTAAMSGSEDLTAAEVNPKKITAAGFAVVNQGSGIASVRILAFNLLYT